MRTNNIYKRNSEEEAIINHEREEETNEVAEQNAQRFDYYEEDSVVNLDNSERSEQTIENPEEMEGDKGNNEEAQAENEPAKAEGEQKEEDNPRCIWTLFTNLAEVHKLAFTKTTSKHTCIM